MHVAFRRAKVLRPDALDVDVAQGFGHSGVAQDFSPARVVAQALGDSAVARNFSPAKVALIIAAIPILATLVYDWTTGHTRADWIREAAGVPIGGAIAWIISRGACEKVSKVN